MRTVQETQVAAIVEVVRQLVQDKVHPDGQVYVQYIIHQTIEDAYHITLHQFVQFEYIGVFALNQGEDFA